MIDPTIIDNVLPQTQCEECDFMCSNAGNLRRHIETVHRKTSVVRCPQCNKEISKYNLNSHINNFHNRQEKSECKICGKVLLRKAGMEYHMRKVHKI